MSWTKHNLNDAVRVKLTDMGIEHMAKKRPLLSWIRHTDDYYKFDELWVFMDVFGDIWGTMQAHKYMDINILIEK